MGRYILLIKRIGAKQFIGGIPAKPKATLSQLKKLIHTKKRAGFSIKIISLAQFKTLKNRKMRLKKKILKKKKRR